MTEGQPLEPLPEVGARPRIQALDRSLRAEQRIIGRHSEIIRRHSEIIGRHSGRAVWQSGSVAWHRDSLCRYSEIIGWHSGSAAHSGTICRDSVSNADGWLGARCQGGVEVTDLARPIQMAIPDYVAGFHTDLGRLVADRNVLGYRSVLGGRCLRLGALRTLNLEWLAGLGGTVRRLAGLVSPEGAGVTGTAVPRIVHAVASGLAVAVAMFFSLQLRLDALDQPGQVHGGVERVKLVHPIQFVPLLVLP